MDRQIAANTTLSPVENGCFTCNIPTGNVNFDVEFIIINDVK